jgi:glycosyltransferase involved in cell wall biosynthesis
MNIGLDIRELQTGMMTGIGRYLTNFLHWAIPANPDCRFYLYGNQKTSFDYPASNVVLRIIPEWCTLWWDQVILPYQIKRDRLDVFLSSYIKCPLLASAPVVTTIHDLLFLVLPEYRRSRLWEAFYKCLAGLAAAKARVIVTPSLFSRRDIIRLLRIPEDKIQVTPLGVAEDYYQQPDPDTLAKIKSRFGISGRYILYVGNFKPHKNVARLVRAYSLLESSLRDSCQLVLGGRRDRYARQIHDLVASLKLQQRVVFTDMVADEELPALYSGAELFAFPSLYEGFGLPVIEAMASGTAVITSNATSLPEVAGDGALLVDPRDTAAIAGAISRLLTDPALRREYIAKGLSRARRFHARRTGALVFEQLKRAVRDKNGAVVDNR